MHTLLTRFEEKATPSATVALCCVLPLVVAASTLYQHPLPAVRELGKYAHLLSVLCVFFAGMVFGKGCLTKTVITLLLPAAWIFSDAAGDIRTVYLVVLMFAFFLAGAALLLIRPAYVSGVVFAVAGGSLIMMILQFYGWPHWINNHATHGLTGLHVGAGLKPTLFIRSENLEAILWQVRTAGVFTSNQKNTLFFFVFFAFAISHRQRVSMIALPFAALYAVLTLSKAAIIGSVIICGMLAWTYRGEYAKRALAYVLCLLLAMGTFFVLFEGVMRIYLSPHVFLTSVMARALNLLDVIGLRSQVDTFIISLAAQGFMKDLIRGLFMYFAGDADANATMVDYGSGGNLSAYAELANAPGLSAFIIVLAIAVAIRLDHNNHSWWRFSPLQCALTIGLLFFTIVGAISTLQSFWVWAGMALTNIYGGLVQLPAQAGFASNTSASLKSSSVSISGERSGGIS